MSTRPTKRSSRRVKTIVFRGEPELYRLLQAAAEVEGLSTADLLRDQTEKAARRSLRQAGLRAGIVLAQKYPPPPNLHAWETAKIPYHRAVAWHALGIDVEQALDLELLRNEYPADYIKRTGVETAPEE